MVFAAGFGTRMRPLSQWCAKPAMPVCGWPLLRYALETLRAAGVGEVVVNSHHRPEDVERVIADVEDMDLRVVVESPGILGTAGGLYNVRDFLTGPGEPFVVMNGDTLIELELASVLEHHREAESMATMVLRKDPRQADFGELGYDAQGRIRDFVGRVPVPEDVGELDRALFTGVHVMDPSVFDFIDEGFGGLGQDTYPRVLRAGESVSAHLQKGYWSDVGTPGRYLEANLDLATGQAPSLALDPARGPVRASGSAVVADDARLAEDVQLERCVVWPGAEVPSGRYADCILVSVDGELRNVSAL